jgi:hypothetical protein
MESHTLVQITENYEQTLKIVNKMNNPPWFDIKFDSKSVICFTDINYIGQDNYYIVSKTTGRLIHFAIYASDFTIYSTKHQSYALLTFADMYNIIDLDNFKVFTCKRRDRTT